MAYSGEESYSSFSSEDVDFDDEEVNNERLRIAIQYMTAEGAGDPTEVYLHRLQILDQHILGDFVEQEKSFDHRLYNRLHALVREVQSDIQEIEEVSSLSSASESSVEALYREVEDDSDVDLSVESSVGSSVEELYRAAEGDFDDDSSIEELYRELEEEEPESDVIDNAGNADESTLKKSFLYGGPANPPEKWFKGLPGVLPFGENPYMEQWESMKINYDLTQSGTRKEISIASTNVPYDDVAKENKHCSFVPSQFDSGSRFKLPAVREDYWRDNNNKDYKSAVKKSWVEMVRSFNAGGPLQEKKNYAPRLVLPQMRLYPDAEDPPYVATKEASDAAAGRSGSAKGRVRRGTGADPSYRPSRRPSDIVDPEVEPEPTTPEREELEELHGTTSYKAKRAHARKPPVDPTYELSASPEAETPSKRKRDLDLGRSASNKRHKSDTTPSKTATAKKSALKTTAKKRGARENPVSTARGELRSRMAYRSSSR